ncbi:MAG: TonB-dependent receptor [Rhodospirillaceae bacterium]|nr:TonB-dependent receptor [Rhodospirillaceae bacterium]
MIIFNLLASDSCNRNCHSTLPLITAIICFLKLGEIMKRDRLLTTVAALAVAMTGQLAVALPVLAQTQSAQSTGGLEEIVVTARKKAENLVDVPLAITAFTMEDIEQSGINSVSDLATQTVGFSYKQGFGRLGSGSGGGASNRPAIRGQSNILGAPNASFFVDGVYVSGNPSSYQLDNLERVEVIRGPQAALFGRGTFAGAINFITRKPTNEYTGKVELTAGQFDHYEGNAYVSGPLVEDKLFFEISGRYFSFGGDYFNQVTQKRDIGDQKTKNFGGKIYATPTDDLTIEANVGYAHDQDLGFADFFNGNARNNCFLPVLTTPLAGIPRSTTRSQGYFCGEIELPNQFFYFNDAIKASGEWGNERKVWRSSLTVDYDIGDWTLHSVSAYNQSEDNQLIDSFVDGVRRAAITTLSGGRSSVHDWSQEFRVSSPQEEPVRGLFGGYYYKEGNGSGFTRNVSVVQANLGQITVNGVFNDDASNVRNFAVFGLLEGELTEDLTASFEGRYQEDKISADFTRDGIVDDSKTTKTFLPRGTLRYELNDDSNVYGTIARGNKPAAYNVVPTNITAASLAAYFAANAQNYDEETSWSYELGYKGALVDNRVNVSSSVFWIDWSNQALTNGFPIQQTNGTFTTAARLVNAGKSRVRGLELDASVRANEYFDFRIGYAYNEAEIRDYIDENEQNLRDTDGRIGNEATQGDSNGQTAGNKIPQTPAHQLILTGNFRMPVNNTMDAFLRSDLTYEGNRFDQTHNLARTGDSYLLNIRAGVETGAWSMTFFVNNALQDRTPLVITRLFNFNAPLLIPDPITTFAGQPLRFTFFRDFRVGAPRKRQIGATLLYRF